MSPLKSFFESEDYLKYRLPYPLQVFEPLRPYLFEGKAPLRVLDLGAGTGFASESFLKFYPYVELTLVEPDSRMLDAAMRRFKENQVSVNAILSTAEAVSVSLDQRFDVVLIGSAWHWMDREALLDRLPFYLKDRGLLYIFEYRFPLVETASLLHLNEWIRRQFNLKWKAPGQSPRGSLQELSQGVRNHSDFVQRAVMQHEERSLQDVTSFLGMIFSQSRFLHFEAQLIALEKQKYREEIKQELEKMLLKEESLSLLYPFQGFLFQKRI